MPKLLQLILFITVLLLSIFLVLVLISVIAGFDSVWALIDFLKEYLLFIWNERLLK